jgi:hypothetical protein
MKSPSPAVVLPSNRTTGLPFTTDVTNFGCSSPTPCAALRPNPLLSTHDPTAAPFAGSAFAFPLASTPFTASAFNHAVGCNPDPGNPAPQATGPTTPAATTLTPRNIEQPEVRLMPSSSNE